MRIKMSGSYRSHEFLDAVDCIVQTLVANGVDEFRSPNIYIEPFRNDQLVRFQDQETGAPFKVLEFRGHNNREFKTSSPRIHPVKPKPART